MFTKGNIYQMSSIKQLSLIASTAITLCLYTVAAKPSQAAVIDFNDSLINSTGNVTNPGIGQVDLSSTGATDADGPLQQFLNLNSTDLDIGGIAFEGSAVKINLAADAGDEFSLTWGFLTSEPTSLNPSNDFGFVAINGDVTTLADVNSGSNTGSFTETFNTAGNYEVAIGVVDVADFNEVSSLQIRNANTDAQPVPEPLTILGSGVALAFGAILRRKYSEKQA